MISINISELIWTVINFFLLLFLLNRFLYKPVISFMEQRQARIDARLREEEEAKACIEENDARILEEKTRSREEAKKILAPLVMQVLSLLFCLIQALVFTMLLSIYVSEAAEEEEE